VTGCMKCDIGITADNYHHEWTLMCDSCYGLWQENVKVKTASGQLQPLKLTRLQRLIWEAYATAVKRGKSVNFEIVKHGRMQ